MDTTADPEIGRGAFARLGGWAAAHRRRVIGAWVVALVAAMGLAHAAGTRYTTSVLLSGTQSQRATDLLRRDFPAQSGDSDQIVLHVRNGRVTDAAIRDRVAPMLATVATLPHVTGVVSPYSPAGARAISADGAVAYATVAFDEQANDLPVNAINGVIRRARSARSAQLEVELGGAAIQATQKPTLGAATAIGLIAAIVILLLTFGSVSATALPILTALLGLGTALGLAGLSSHVVATPDFATELAALIGLGVGIDYALFIVTRFRDSYRRGATVSQAIAAAMDTAGRAVLFAGLTVIIALLGLFALGVSLLYGVAVSAALAVLMTMLAALTMLPVLLSRFGERIGGARQRPHRIGWLPHPRRAFWPRWTALIQRHPWPGLTAGLVIMLALSASALGMRLGFSDAGNDPVAKTTRHAYDLLAQGFGRGANGPLVVVAHLSRPGDREPLARIAATVRETPDVAAVSAARLSRNGETAVFTVAPRSAPQAAATTHLVNELRSRRLTPVSAATGAAILIGGQEATSIDFTRVLSDKLPLFIAVVVVVSALLLLAVFRSIAIPIQAAVMNLLSVTASLGVIAAVFQRGWLAGVFGVAHAPIEPYIPVVMFAIVFGLSMDYEVFLVSRVREAWSEGHDPSRAVFEGFASTGRVITAAATIMLVVFMSFVISDERVLKVFGLALASAVFLDAFVVRSLLLPSVLQLLGRHTWRLPAAIDRRLPRLAIDAPQGAQP